MTNSDLPYPCGEWLMRQSVFSRGKAWGVYVRKYGCSETLAAAK